MGENNRQYRISLDDFLLLMVQEQGGVFSAKSARKYLDSLISVMLQQLKLNDSVYVYNLGTFYLREYGGEIRKMGDVRNGGTINRFLDPKLHIGFTPAKIFERAVNDNDFKIVKNKTTRKYTAKEKKEIHNERRRKPRKCMDELFCEMTNELEGKK